MKIPKTFRLGALSIKVSRKKQTIGDDGKEWNGYYDRDNGVIWVSPEAADEAYTFWHEFFHAACYDAGIQQVNGWSGDLEEIVCEKFGRYVADFLRRKK